MSETIDMKEWLPRDAPVINPFRLQHGDLDGITRRYGKSVKVVAAWRKDQSILASLIERGFLEDIHRFMGLDLLELRNSVYGPLNAKTTAYIHSMGDCGLSRGRAETVYYYTIKTLNKNREQVVIHAMESQYADDAAAKHTAGINAYRESFEVLERSLRDALDHLKELMEKGLA
jgi:hypothetical protein